MSTEPRTAHVNVLVTKSLEIDEPAWCVDPHDSAQFLPDITHNGPETTARVATQHGTATFLAAWITQAPHAQLAPEPLPVVAIEVDGDTLSLDPDDVPAFTGLIRAHLDVIEQLAAECARIRGGGQ
ncbi:hypothetical protein AB0L04_22530 [Streptomyces glaucescens]|uniref:DUF6907 domain-containing protein n=1 Tax=Streptomyces glaucescens TaxID=1907 RepID=UPI0034500D22